MRSRLRIEHIVNWRKLRTFLLTVLFLSLIPATRYYQIDVPLIRFLKGPLAVDPLSLHLAGEFVENNLGTEQGSDGSVTVRMIAQQYLFVPHCILVPAGVPIHLRITSADAVHSLNFEGTKYNVKVLPGTISEAQLQFASAGEFKTACAGILRSRTLRHAIQIESGATRSIPCFAGRRKRYLCGAITEAAPGAGEFGTGE